MATCEQFCTKAKCEQLEAEINLLKKEIAFLKQELNKKLDKTDFQKHLNDEIPQAHKYNPQVKVDVGLAWNSQQQSLKVFVRVDVDQSSGNDEEIIPLNFSLKEEYCTKEECEFILSELQQLQFYFNQHINSLDAHGLAQLKQDLKQLQDYFNQHINSTDAHGLTQIKSDLQQTQKFLNEHINSNDAHGLKLVNFSLKKIQDKLNQHINLPWNLVHKGSELKCDLSPLTSQLKLVETQINNNLVQIENSVITKIKSDFQAELSLNNQVLTASIKAVVAVFITQLENSLKLELKSLFDGLSLDFDFSKDVKNIESNLKTSITSQISAISVQLTSVYQNLNNFETTISNQISPILNLLKELNLNIGNINVDFDPVLSVTNQLQQSLQSLTAQLNQLALEVDDNSEFTSIFSLINQIKTDSIQLIGLNNQIISLINNLNVSVDLSPLELALVAIDVKVTVIKNAVEAPLSGEIPIGGCLAEENGFSYQQSLIQSYSGSNFAAVLQAIGFLSEQIEAVHQDTCKSITPLIDIPSLEVIECTTTEGGELQFSSKPEVKTAAIWQSTNQVPAGYLLPELAQVLLEQSQETYKLVCELKESQEESGSYAIIPSAKTITFTKDQVLILSFTTVEDYPSLPKERSVWSLQIPNPIPLESIDWCTDIDPIRYYKGQFFTRLKTTGSYNGITIWAQSRELANQFLDQLMPLTQEKEINRVYTEVKTVTYPVKVQTLRPRRAYYHEFNPDGTTKNRFCFKPPENGCE